MGVGLNATAAACPRPKLCTRADAFRTEGASARGAASSSYSTLGAGMFAGALDSSLPMDARGAGEGAGTGVKSSSLSL